MVKLRHAEIGEAEGILEFYRGVIDSIRDSDFKPKWSDRYPNIEFIEKSIEKRELYICTENDHIISCVVLNNRFDPEYENIEWNIDAEPAETLIIHTFAVNSESAGKGIGKELFSQIKSNALSNNLKAIRLDIIYGNVGAQKVFEKFGFEYVDTVELFHPAVGLERFHLYECVLK